MAVSILGSPDGDLNHPSSSYSSQMARPGALRSRYLPRYIRNSPCLLLFSVIPNLVLSSQRRLNLTRASGSKTSRSSRVFSSMSRARRSVVNGRRSSNAIRNAWRIMCWLRLGWRSIRMQCLMCRSRCVVAVFFYVGAVFTGLSWIYSVFTSTRYGCFRDLQSSTYW